MVTFIILKFSIQLLLNFNKKKKLTTKVNKLQADLEVEKELNKCLTSNQEVYQTKLTTLEENVKRLNKEKDGEIDELKLQLRDIMFYLDAQSKCADSKLVSKEELQDGHLIIQQDQATGSSTLTGSAKAAANRKRKN
jgi:BRCA1-associated protein